VNYILSLASESADYFPLSIKFTSILGNIFHYNAFYGKYFPLIFILWIDLLISMISFGGYLFPRFSAQIPSDCTMPVFRRCSHCLEVNMQQKISATIHFLRFGISPKPWLSPGAKEFGAFTFQ